MRFRVRELLLLPGLLSLSRIPLAVCFPFCVGRPFVAASILVAAGLTDVADGWVARRYRQVTATGTILDPVTDKLFVLTVAVTLVVHRHLSLISVVLLGAREILELPLLLWFVLSRAARAQQPTADALGKFATVLQFLVVCWALFRGPRLSWWVTATAVAGTLAAAHYWIRSLRSPRASAGRI